MRSWSGYVVFFAVITAIVGGVHYYLYARLIKASSLSPGLERGFGLAIAAFALLTPATVIGARFLPRSVGSVVGLVGFSWLGLVVLMFFLTVGSEVIRIGTFGLTQLSVLPDDPARRTFLGRALAGSIAGAASVLGVYGVSSARGTVSVERVKIALKRFPESLGGFRLVQLSDVHIGPTIGGEWLAGVVETVNGLEPDLVAITGDLVDGTVADLAQHVAPLKNLRAKHGVYFVTGNHEYYSGVDEWIAHLRAMGITVLRNERVSIGEGDTSFDLAGVDDWRAKEFGGDHGPDLARALEGRDPTRELVLLAHQPKQAELASKAGVGLQLSGHTHGGQIFPWNYFVKLDQPFVAGIDKLGDLTVYTSRGTGYWGPPMRVGAPPEITLLELRRA